MLEESAEGTARLYELSAALMTLVGHEVVATVLVSQGPTLARFEGILERAFELPGREDEVLLIELSTGIVPIRASEVEVIDSWRDVAGGWSYRSVAVVLRSGLSLLIQEDFMPIVENPTSDA